MTLVMVVDDDQDLAEMLGIVLNDAGIDVDLVSRGDEVLDAFREKVPDLILLDVMLPGIDGVEVCRLIRAQSMVPIIMLTAKGETEDVVRGLEAGADDYMVKPFRHASELVARVRTRLRRNNTDVLGLISVGDLKIDVQAHQILRDGKLIQLTRLEFDLLVALAREPGRVFTRDALLSEVWGYAQSTDTRLVNVHIQRLRAKVERDPENPKIVITIRGVGYKAGDLVGS